MNTAPDFVEPSTYIPTVLVVENNLSDLGVLSDCLQEIGLKMLVAQDGESALEKAWQEQPDLILISEILPGINGFETCRRLKAIEALQSVPVIFVTTLSDIADRTKVFQAGGDDYIAKPFHCEEVRTRLETHLAMHALKRRNRELTMLYETAIAISSHLSLDAVLRTVAEQMTRALDSSGCALSLWKREENEVETLVDYSAPYPDETEQRGTIYSLTDYPITRRVLETGEPVLIHHSDLTADESELVLLEQWEVHTLLMLPLTVGERVIGLVELFDEVKRRDFTPEQIRLARSMASQAAIAIDNARLYEQAQQEIAERKRTEEALRESEERWRRLVEHNPACLAVHSEGKLLYANLAGLQLLHADSLDQVLGKPILDFVHPDYREIVIARVRQMMEQDRPTELLEEKFLRLDGGIIDVEVTAIPITYMGERAIITVIWDVTERKRAEEALFHSLKEKARSHRMLMALSQAAQAVQRVHAPEDVYRTIGQEIGNLGCDIAIFTLTDDRAHLFLSYLTFQSAALRAVEKLIDMTRQSFQIAIMPGGIYDRIVSRGQAFFFEQNIEPLAESLPKLGRPLLKQIAAMLKLERVIYAPLKIGDDTHGLLTVVGAGLTEADVPAVTAFAGQAAIALENARLYAEARQEINVRKQAEEAEREQRQLAEALRDTAAALNSTIDLSEVLELVLANVERVVPHDAANVMLVEKGVARIVGQHGYAKRGLNHAVLTVRYKVEEVTNLRQIARIGRPLVIPDTRNYRGWVLSQQTRWIRSYVGVPIRIGKEIIGFLNLDSATPRFFTDIHAEHLQAFADQAAVAIVNAQLYEQVQRHAAELERRVAERTTELQAANERLQALSQVKDEFVSNVSHELRTPITNIQLYHDLLECNPEKINAYMATLERETTRLADIVEGLLQLSRLDQERVKVTLGPVDLNDIAGLYADDRALLAESKGIKLAFERKAVPLVQADQKLLGQALSIFLTNALNYTPYGGQIMIKTWASRIEGAQWAGVSVIDSGPGIPLEEQTHLFERFYRGTAGRHSGIPGTGLGLAIAKEIVDRHSGQIKVESEGISGQGTAFSIWLPANAST